MRSPLADEVCGDGRQVAAAAIERRRRVDRARARRLAYQLGDT